MRFGIDFFCKSFDMVFSISPTYITKLTKLHSCKVLQTYNGVEKEIYTNLNVKRKKQILAVGALKEAKGIRFLIEGFDLFLKEYPDLYEYNLVIVGQGILLDEISKMISELKIENKVTLAGQKVII